MGQAEALLRSNASPSRDLLQIESEIEASRSELDRLLDELDRRRRELLNVRAQVGRHPVAAAIAAAVVGGAVAVWLRARRRRQRPLERARRAGSALVRLLDGSDRFATQPSLAQGALTLAASVAASLVVRGLLDRAVRARGSVAASA